ncbi:hypothetical protein OM076_42870 [Solirubrobacter ginsenosidimutans]|uniref:Uncharacterized protein n=1 Tax=Solirubrobacter ginsenosidimutans TaxID=490573 RepID=A0A9X3N4F7_9ACTN|nr:hypothetical protein [Solirubrobacter ginsenosidimutans]MDA0167081.1 hypothetical protein [Solirubrobacter ginsenosidimutans]
MSTPDAATLRSADPKVVVGAFGTLSLATITLLTVFTVVEWTAAQTALLTAEVAAVGALFAAALAHLKKGTAKEHVALAATFTASVSATLALGSGFAWWSLTEAQTGALLGIVTAVIGVASGLFARGKVEAPTTARVK